MLNWKLIDFNEFTPQGLYDVMKLRTDVFVVEQTCAYPELDNKDQVSKHFCGYNSDGELIAYTRILPPGISYTEASIGRVVVAESARDKKYGKVLMKLSIDITQNLYPEADIRIGAQCYLEKFYTDLGFNTKSEPYLEDGIPHIEMVLPESEALY